jgi:hypothetical protein
MTDNKAISPSNNQILMYQTDNGELQIEVIYKGESVWLTQKQMAKLFNTDQSGVARHIKNIYHTDELREDSTMQKLHNANSAKPVKYYNLDVIISVGYRVNSYRGTQFRMWATQKLREYIIKGFVMDDNRLADGQSNYFDELIERVRDIRTSERNFYEKVKDLFRMSIDYNVQTESAQEFYATVQNKFHYAIHEHTSAELIAERIDSAKDNMGLTSWKGKVLSKDDARIAKNYLTYNELKRLQLLADQFLAFAELRAFEQHPMYMRDWLRKLDECIKFNEKPILTHAGKVSRKDMEQKVREELEKYRERLSIEEGTNALLQDKFMIFLEDAAKPFIPPDPDDDLKNLD